MFVSSQWVLQSRSAGQFAVVDVTRRETVTSLGSQFPPPPQDSERIHPRPDFYFASVVWVRSDLRLRPSQLCALVFVLCDSATVSTL